MLLAELSCRCSLALQPPNGCIALQSEKLLAAWQCTPCVFLASSRRLVDTSGAIGGGGWWKKKEKKRKKSHQLQPAGLIIRPGHKHCPSSRLRRVGFSETRSAGMTGQEASVGRRQTESSAASLRETCRAVRAAQLYAPTSSPPSDMFNAIRGAISGKPSTQDQDSGDWCSHIHHAPSDCILYMSMPRPLKHEQSGCSL